MVNLNSRETRNGAPIMKGHDMTPSTKMNVTDERCQVCAHARIDTECLCDVTEQTPEVPAYTEAVEKRIQAAIERARTKTRRAHYLGHNTNFDFDLYGVYSSRPGKPSYAVRVYTSPVLNAFAYLPPYAYIRCECQAAQAGSPCWHAAKVALRIQRECIAKSRRVEAPAVKPAEKPARKYTLESLFEDVA